MLLEYDMTGLFTANHIAVCHHILADILITNGSLLIMNPQLIKSLIQSHVRHNCRNYGIVL